MKRFEVWLVDLDPTRGSEIKKTRPCVIISPDEMQKLKTVIVAPMTTKGFLCFSRIPTNFEGKENLIVLDQMRAVDKGRLVKKLGSLDEMVGKAIAERLVEMFT